MDLLNNEEVLSESNYIPATPAKSVPTKRTLISVFNGEGAAAFESLIDVPVALLTPFTENSASVSSNKIDTPSLAPITPDKDGSRDMLQDVALEERIDLNKKVSFRDVNLASGEDEEEETQGIDLNKTPRKKFTRRKKHRPKVIQEGKPTKSPMPATPKIAEDKEKPLRTRSYVRRNKASNSSKTPSDSSEEDEDKEKPVHKRTYVRRNKSLNSLNTQLCKTEENKESPIPIKTYVRRKKVQIGETTDPCSLNPSNATKSVRRSLDFSSPEGETKDEHHISTPSDVDNTVCSRKFTVEFNQGLEVVVTESPSGIAFDLNRSINEVLAEYIRLPTSSDQEKFEYCNRSDDILINDIDTTGIKRKHDYINAGCGGTKETNSCQEMNGLSPDFPMIFKKRRTHRGKALGCNNELLRKLSTCYSFTDVPQLTDFYRFQQLELTLALPSIEGATRKRSEIPTRARTPIAGAGDCNHLLWSPEQPKQNNVRKEKYILAPETCMDALFADTRYNITKRQRNKGHFRLVGSVFDNMKRECTVASSRFSFLGQPFVLGLEANAPFYPQTAVSYLDPVEIIVAKMRRMKITDDHQVKSLSETENALIPFNGGGMMVPYRHLFDLIRKRGARAKVDLDPETNRVWNLLMGKKSNQADDVDEDKEKWWENERQIFRGRADAFIARMHLILGDRRFSKWKGSVVDSVVGVFLTQNVTDHLSSSAFMSLAAKFPPRPEDNGKDENEECIETSTESLGDTNWQEKMSMPEAIDPGSIGAHEKEKAATDLSSSHESNNRNETDYSKGNDLNFHGREQEIDHEGIVSPATSMSQIIQNSSNTDPVEVENVCVLRERIGPCLTSTSVEITEIYDINVIEDDSGSRLMPANSITTMAVESSSKTENSLREKHKLLQMHDELNILTETQHHGEQTANVSSCNDFEMLETMKEAEVNMKNEACSSQTVQPQNVKSASRANKVNAKTHVKGWKGLQKEALADGASNQRSSETMDSLDWEAVRNADVNEISHTIRERGMNNVLAGRIKDFLNRLVKDHGSIDLEWLRHVPPDKAKDYLLSIRGLGIKSVECVRLLTLHHLAFPVDTNVGRICVRLGWVPLQPLPESLQLHLLELYPMIEHIQKYLWPRLCTLDQRTLYELHYQMITFGKVFCTKTKPNCNACPMRGECKHFASAFTSAKLALPGPEERRLITSTIPSTFENDGGPYFSSVPLPQLESSQPTKESARDVCEPIIEEPDTPEPDNTKDLERDIEDAFYENLEEIPTIKLSLEDFKNNIKTYMQENNIEIEDGDMSKALVAITAEAASIPMSKLKNVNRLRTEHQVYELPDSHPLLEGVDQRVPDDPCPYLLAIWTPGETAQSTEPPQSCCNSQGSSKLCKKATCFACNSIREALAQTVRGTLLIPCRTAMKGSFPLNGTYFQVNEVFADHNSSRKPISVPREWIWNLPRRTVFFGTSVSTIFKGLPMEDIQHCFWRGFVCVRGFDRASRAPKPLYARLHFPPSKAVKNNKDTGKGKEERYINKML